MRDLFTSMERSGGSFPPIMMLNVLHMCFPQFAQKNDQGVFQQQVISTHCLPYLHLKGRVPKAQMFLYVMCLYSSS